MLLRSTCHDDEFVQTVCAAAPPSIFSRGASTVMELRGGFEDVKLVIGVRPCHDTRPQSSCRQFVRETMASVLMASIESISRIRTALRARLFSGWFCVCVVLQAALEVAHQPDNSGIGGYILGRLTSWLLIKQQPSLSVGTLPHERFARAEVRVAQISVSICHRCAP